MGPKEDWCICPIPLFSGFEPQFSAMCPLKLWFFRNCLSVETCNKCHWIWHALNIVHTCTIQVISMHFSQSKSTKCEFFAWNCDFSGTAYCIETHKPECHWIWHTLNPKYAPLKQFQCIFPSQNQQNVKFWLSPEIPLIFQELLFADTQFALWQKWFGKSLQTLHTHHSSHFGYAICNPLCQNFVWQNVKFWAISWTPPISK